nr:hypothetical protein [Tanacetum cinerariifolium]
MLRRLREELEADVALANNLLDVLTRFVPDDKPSFARNDTFPNSTQACDRPLRNELIILIFHFSRPSLLWDNLNGTDPKAVENWID